MSSMQKQQQHCLCSYFRKKYISSEGFVLLCIISILIHVNRIDAHSRWVCPPPRNPDTGIKVGPCGSETNVFDSSVTGSPLTISPGPLLVQWEESILHTGAPFRIALSQDGSDTEQSCTLIDHIPHFDSTIYPTFGDDSTYILYSLTIEIPDIQCDSCSLHLSNPMTDKIGEDGAPNGIGCTDPDGTCFSVYHSCTIPITITGTTPRSQYTCPNTNPSDWPTTWNGDNGQTVDASVFGLYRRESATWEQSFLMDVSDNYRTINSNLLSCTNTDLFPTQVEVPVPVTTVPITQPTSLSPTNTPNTMIPTTLPDSSPTILIIQEVKSNLDVILDMIFQMMNQVMIQIRHIF